MRCQVPSLPFPPSPTIHSHRKVNSQALPWPFSRALLGQTTGAPRGTTLRSLLLTAGRAGRGKNPGSVHTADPRLSGLHSPSKPAPSRDSTLGGREEGQRCQSSGPWQGAGEAVQLSATPRSAASIIRQPRCRHGSTGGILCIYRADRDGARSVITLLHNSRARLPATRALQQESDGNRGVTPGTQLVLTQQGSRSCILV